MIGTKAMESLISFFNASHSLLPQTNTYIPLSFINFPSLINFLSFEYIDMFFLGSIFVLVSGIYRGDNKQSENNTESESNKQSETNKQSENKNVEILALRADIHDLAQALYKLEHLSDEKIETLEKQILHIDEMNKIEQKAIRETLKSILERLHNVEDFLEKGDER